MDVTSLPRVLGIDPGLNTTGYGVLEAAVGGPRLCEAGVVRGRDRKSLAARVHDIHAGIAEVIAAMQPAAVAIEELYSHYDRPRTSILMGHARGVICLAAAQAGIPVLHYSATKVKKVLTGSGRAAEEPDAAGRAAGAAALDAPGTARRGRRFGHRPVPLLSATRLVRLAKRRA